MDDKVTALERINQIEKWVNRQPAPTNGNEPVYEVQGFLLKAFKTMRKIAIDNGNDELTMRQEKLGYGVQGIDNAFESLMNQPENSIQK